MIIIVITVIILIVCCKYIIFILNYSNISKVEKIKTFGHKFCAEPLSTRTKDLDPITLVGCVWLVAISNNKHDYVEVSDIGNNLVTKCFIFNL